MHGKLIGAHAHPEQVIALIATEDALEMRHVLRHNRNVPFSHDVAVPAQRQFRLSAHPNSELECWMSLIFVDLPGQVLTVREYQLPSGEAARRIRTGGFLAAFIAKYETVE